jgi:hypothetical protein
LDHGFEQSKSNYSPFTRLQGTSYIALLVYVDGIIIFGNNANAIVQLSAYLNTQFYLKDLGPMKYILGFEIARTAAGISVCQWKYTLEILEDSGLLAANHVLFPMDSNLKLSKDKCFLLTDATQYRRLIGRLIYLTITKPNIAYLV